MISAERFAKGRASYWSELLPRLEPFVRANNVIADRFAAPIASGVASERRAFVAELAFELMRIEIQDGKPPTTIGREGIVAHVRSRIARLGGINEEQVALPSEAEQDETLKLREALRVFLSNRRPASIHVSPHLAGCGIIDDCEADLLLRRQSLEEVLTGSTDGESEQLLFEVKIVARPFRAVDFRQLITYCALMSASGTAPDVVGLVNPRLGTYSEFRMDELAIDTAGVTGNELLQQIIFDVSTAEISL